MRSLMLMLVLVSCFCFPFNALAGPELGGAAGKAEQTAPAAKSQVDPALLASPDKMLAWLNKHTPYDLYTGIFGYKYGDTFTDAALFDKTEREAGRDIYVKTINNSAGKELVLFVVETLRGKVSGFRFVPSSYNFGKGCDVIRKYSEQLQKEYASRGLAQSHRTIFPKGRDFEAYTDKQGAYVGFHFDNVLAGRSPDNYLDPYLNGIDGVAFGEPYENKAIASRPSRLDPDNVLIYEPGDGVQIGTYQGMLWFIGQETDEAEIIIQDNYRVETNVPNKALKVGDSVISCAPGWLQVENEKTSRKVEELKAQKAQAGEQAVLADAENKYKDVKGGYRSYKYGMSPAEVKALLKKEYPDAGLEDKDGGPLFIKPEKDFTTFSTGHLAGATGKAASAIYIQAHGNPLGASGLPVELAFYDNKLVAVIINIQMGTEKDIYDAVAEKYAGKEYEGTYFLLPDNKDFAVMNNTAFDSRCVFGQNEYNVVCAYTMAVPLDEQRAGTSRPNALNRKYFADVTRVIYADPAYYKAAQEASENAGKAGQAKNKSVID